MIRKIILYADKHGMQKNKVHHPLTPARLGEIPTRGDIASGWGGGQPYKELLTLRIHYEYQQGVSSCE